MTAHLTASSLYREATHVALYWPLADEADLRGLLGMDAAAEHAFYLPRILAGRCMEYRPCGDPARLVYNRWGIAEPSPETGMARAPQALDLVCVPLLGFDRRGNRLGQGGGFYDRTFAFVREQQTARPRLLGVAFACQEVASIEHEPWDVSLHAVITEDGIIDCTSRAQRRKA